LHPYIIRTTPLQVYILIYSLIYIYSTYIISPWFALARIILYTSNKKFHRTRGRKIVGLCRFYFRVEDAKIIAALFVLLDDHCCSRTAAAAADTPRIKYIILIKKNARPSAVGIAAAAATWNIYISVHNVLLYTDGEWVILYIYIGRVGVILKVHNVLLYYAHA